MHGFEGEKLVGWVDFGNITNPHGHQFTEQPDKGRRHIVQSPFFSICL